MAIDAGTGQETTSEPETDPKEEIIKLRRRIEEKDKQTVALQASQKVKDIPQLVNDKIGLIKVQNLSRIRKDDIRGFQVLARRCEETIRRRLTEVGHASIKLYIMNKDGTTNVESLVPVAFTVDMMGRTTELILDESRL